MSDKESDGPQKSFSAPWKEQKFQEQEHHEGDKVNMKTGTNAKPEPYEVHKARWNGKEWEYQVKRQGEKEIYSEIGGNRNVDWFPESELEAVG